MRKRQKSYKWGHAAEFLCCALLVLKGYRILARRHKTPMGEVDIVAAKSKMLVFIEVKARPSVSAGIEAISVNQRSRIERAASYFMSRPAFSNRGARFDIMVARPWRLPYHLVDAWRH